MKPIRLTLIASLLTLPVVTVTEPVIAQTQTQNQYTGVTKQVDDIAQQITVLINSKNNGNGSGVIVAKEGNTYYALTAAHVVQNPDDYTLVAPDGTTYQLDRSQMTILKEVDLAVVQFTAEKTYSVATLARYNVKDRFWVFVSGFPKSLQEKRSQRLLTAGIIWKQEEADFKTKDQYSLNSGGRGLVDTSLSMAGMSGGPVLDSRGYVVGINTAAENEFDTTQAGQTIELNLGFSLGVPIGTFIAQTQKTKVQSQWLQIKTTSPPDLTASEVESITANPGSIRVPGTNANAFDWLNYGNHLWRLGRYQEAVSAFEKAIALKNDFDRAYYGKGLALWDANKYPEALAAFEQATQLNPNFPRAWRYLGLTLRDLKKYDSALAAYNKAIELQPDDFVVHVEQGNILQEIGRFTEAVAAYNTALNIKAHPWAYLNRGTAYARLKEYAKAIADFNNTLALNPNFADAYNNRGNVYYYLQQYEKAIADFNSNISLNPEQAETYFNRGNVYRELQDYQSAIADYNSALSLKPDYTDAYNNRGNVYQMLKEYQKAIADYNEALSLNPDYVDAHYNRGLVYKDLQEYEKAIADFDRAIALKPDDALAYGNRGAVYLQLGERKKAIADIEKATQLLCQQRSPKCQQSQEILRQLQAGGS